MSEVPLYGAPSLTEAALDIRRLVEWLEVMNAGGAWYCLEDPQVAGDGPVLSSALVSFSVVKFILKVKYI